MIKYISIAILIINLRLNIFLLLIRSLFKLSLLMDNRETHFSWTIVLLTKQTYIYLQVI